MIKRESEIKNKMSTPEIQTESHPLPPFLPENARLLMLGSFPPQRKRWSMEFYYPNLNNDMWRIFGLIFFADKNFFLREDLKAFMPDKISDFLHRKGIAIFDTARSIRRLQDNASDKFLEVVEPTDIGELLDQIPLCRAIVTTGQKATDTLRMQFEVEEPKVGQYTEFTYKDRTMRLYRMPSSSRAYPLALEKKAAFYRTLFEQIHLLP